MSEGEEQPEDAASRWREGVLEDAGASSAFAGAFNIATPKQQQALPHLPVRTAWSPAAAQVLPATIATCSSLGQACGLFFCSHPHNKATIGRGGMFMIYAMKPVLSCPELCLRCFGLVWQQPGIAASRGPNCDAKQWFYFPV